MIVDEIRSLREADPFRPYKLVLANGDELVVERRSGIGIGPEGRFLVYPLEPAGYRIVRPADVKAAHAVTGTSA